MPGRPHPNSRAQDEEFLSMLDLQSQGLTVQQIADRFGYGRNQVIGILHRIKATYKKDNGVGNGTMPQRWWRK